MSGIEKQVAKMRHNPRDWRIDTLIRVAEHYGIDIRSHIPQEDGGGFLISFPDLPGCISDGETIEQAIANGRDAFIAWISAQADMGRPIPEPTYHVPEASHDMPGKFVQRVPKTIHSKLAALAKQEGVSINTLVLTFIAEGLGRRDTERNAA